MAHTATMNFFESQANARRKTTLLIFYFLFAVAFIIFGAYGAILLALHFTDFGFQNLWMPSLFYGIAAGVLLAVLTGSLYKTIVLSRGGEKVAEMFGATPVLPNSTDPDERKLLNVVEEMAIASGIPVPRVYVIRQEKGINAFAAGLTQGDAVVAVTRGCMGSLTRDELQGVVAHEISHILNGDMRLNLRLMGIIHGILIIALIGRGIFDGMSSGTVRRSGKSSGSGSGRMAAFTLGASLIVVGYIGVLFGKLIKSAVSRQREFLADASAVRFTRNPAGLRGALLKIAGLKDGSRIHNSRADEASHLFFGNGLSEPFLKMLSTHPPMEERIRRIDPLFKSVPQGMESAMGETQELVAGFRQGQKASLSPERLAESVGSPRAEHLFYAERLLADLPPLIGEAAREPFGARALVYCLLLQREEGVRKAQLSLLEEHGNPAVTRHVRMLLPLVDGIGRGYSLPLVDLAIPALKNLSIPQYDRFRKNLERLVEADRRIDLFEYTLRCVVSRRLDRRFQKKPLKKVKYSHLDHIRMEAAELLSILAWEGSQTPAAAEEAFRKGIEVLEPEKAPGGILPREKCSLKLLDAALQRLSEASYPIKETLLKACVLCIGADARINLNEAELLRAVAYTLDCPVPPILPGVLDS